MAGGVRLLTAHLWAREVAARRRPVAARCDTDQWLERFNDHLVHVHGLVVGTRRIYRRYAAALLAECAGTPTPDWSRLTVPTIAAFVQTRASRLRPSACRAPVTATRAFLRFLATSGVVPARIEGAVPTIREWKHASLPRALAADDVQRVLAAVDETRPGGPRDPAILLLLTRLGLRAGEVAALTVNDIDWHDGSVRVAGKGGRERRLPLAADVGVALVAALHSRPPTSPPAVIFVTAQPPYSPEPPRFPGQGRLSRVAYLYSVPMRCSPPSLWTHGMTFRRRQPREGRRLRAGPTIQGHPNRRRARYSSRPTPCAGLSVRALLCERPKHGRSPCRS